jgi:hypothetical protein
MALLEDVAILAARRGDLAGAFSLVGASDALRASLGAPRSAGAEAGLAEQLAPSRDALGFEAANRARQKGSTLDVEAAIELAIQIARGH